MHSGINRRVFLKTTTLGGLGTLILRNSRSAYSYKANEKLSVALIGVGGRGTWFVDTIPRMENVVALCDVNNRKLAEAFQRWEDGAKRYANSPHDWERRAAESYKRLTETKPRKALVWGHTWTHQPNPYAEKALEILGRKTGAFQAVVSDDPRLPLSDRLPQFDALLMNNIHERAPFLPEDFARRTEEQKAAARKFDEAVKKSILDYVRGGKGIVGIHAATAAFQNWPEYGEMMGGYYGGHIYQEAPIKLDDLQRPVNACFGGESWRINDEIYIFRGPYSRQRLHVLLSLDLDGWLTQVSGLIRTTPSPGSVSTARGAFFTPPWVTPPRLTGTRCIWRTCWLEFNSRSVICQRQPVLRSSRRTATEDGMRKKSRERTLIWLR